MKLMVGVTACVMATGLFLASCSGKKEENSASSNGKQKITFMLLDLDGSPLTGEYASEVLQKMSDYTNSDVEFKFVPTDIYDEKLGLTLVSPDEMPMILTGKTMNLSIIDAAKAGAFWDLNEFIWDSEKFPNLSKANKNVCQSLSVDGKLVGIYKARDIGRYGLGYRTDWAEKLGLGEPKTIEDVYNMMKAFTYGDPDGNGVNDTYGMAMCKFTGPLDIIETWFGAGNGWVEQDGKLVPVHQTLEYKKALNWMKKIYEEGLIAPDWAIRDTSTWQDQVKKGEAGIFVDVLDGSRRIWDYFVTNKIPSVADKKKTAGMTLVGPINGKTMATAGHGGFFMITKAAKTKEQVEACLHYLDKMCDDEMVILACYGLKDIHYTIDAEGYLVQKAANDPSVLKSYAALNQTLCFIPHQVQDVKPALRQNERKIKEMQVKEMSIEQAVFNPASAYLTNSVTYAQKEAILYQLIEDARTQYICGQKDEEGLRKAFDLWNKQGGADLIEEVNALYKKQK